MPGGVCGFAKAPNFNSFAADVVAPEASWKYVDTENPKKYLGQG